jgi:hypothetical protein
MQLGLKPKAGGEQPIPGDVHDALITGCYLSGTNTRRVRRALCLGTRWGNSTANSAHVLCWRTIWLASMGEAICNSGRRGNRHPQLAGKPVPQRQPSGHTPPRQ